MLTALRRVCGAGWGHWRSVSKLKVYVPVLTMSLGHLANMTFERKTASNIGLKAYLGPIEGDFKLIQSPFKVISSLFRAYLRLTVNNSFRSAEDTCSRSWWKLEVALSFQGLPPSRLACICRSASRVSHIYYVFTTYFTRSRYLVQYLSI